VHIFRKRVESMGYGKIKKLDLVSYIEELGSIAGDENFHIGMAAYSPNGSLYDFLGSLKGLEKRDAALRILGHGVRYIGEMGPTLELKLFFKAAKESGFLDTIHKEIVLDIVNHASELMEERQQRAETIKSYTEYAKSFTSRFLKEMNIEPSH
jgi:hypothetical protein